MRILLLYIIGGLALGAGVTMLLQYDPGYLYISLGHYTVETSLWLALVGWLALWLLLALIVRGLGRLLRARRGLKLWLGGRKHRNAAALTNRGLVSFIEGNWDRSRKQLLRAARYSEVPLVNHLIAAQASFRLGDLEEMRRQLGLADNVGTDVGVALELTQAELQLAGGNYEQALATLVRARANASKHPHVLELLARSHWALSDWQALRELLPELRKHGLLKAPELAGMERALWDALMAGAQGEDDAIKLWRDAPSAFRDSVSFQRRYLAVLVELGATDKAVQEVLSLLAKQWHSELLLFLSALKPKEPNTVLKQLRKWLEQRGDEPALLLSAGCMALQAERFDDAASWLQASYRLEPSRAAAFSLAQYYEASGDKDQACALWREVAAADEQARVGARNP